MDLKNETLEILNKIKKKIKSENTREGEVAKVIEAQTAKLPSDVFLWASLGTIATSITFKIFKKEHLSLFVGQFTAPIMLLGIYNKLVKQHGHDSAGTWSL